MINTTHQFQN